MFSLFALVCHPNVWGRSGIINNFLPFMHLDVVLSV